MDGIFEREERLVGKDAVLKLKGSKVAVFGLGGVGGAAAEALIRGGVGSLCIFDGDKIMESNINRQFFATTETVGLPKTAAAKKRLLSINPDAEIIEHSFFYTPENSEGVDLKQFDYIVDAIDMVTAKIELVLRANAAGVPIISCMGTGNKLDPTAFEVCDIFKTSVCPLCRVMRKELKERGVTKLKVVYSKEEPITPKGTDDKRTPASISFVPPVAGMILAGEVIKDIIREVEK